MNYEVVEAFGQIVRERNVDKELVIETLKAGLLSAAKRRFGTADHIQVTIDEESGEIRLFATRSVVEGETGVFFQEPTVESLVEALGRLERGRWDPDRIRRHLRHDLVQRQLNALGQRRVQLHL